MPSTGSGTEMRIENVPSTGSGNGMRSENVPSTTLRQRVIEELVAEHRLKVCERSSRSHCVWIFCICFNNTKFTEILLNDGVFEFSKEHQRCSIEYTNFNTIEIMCLRQAQAPCNKRIGGWACRSHCGWNFCVCFYITKSTEILWNDGVFEFSKEHQRCSRKHTNFNAIEIMCLRQAQAPCNKSLVAELVEATMCGIFVFALITQSPRRFVEIIAFLSSQRNIRDVLESTRILMQ